MAKKVGNKWAVDIRPNGRIGPRFRKRFNTQAEARRYEAHIISEHANANKPWQPQRDNRKLSELCNVWFQQHGKNLRDGERRLRKLLSMSNELGDPVARKLTAKIYLEYRTRQTNTPKTLNNELGYLNAVFNELRRTLQINYENPLDFVRPIKLRQNELSFLTIDEINELLQSLSHSENKHVLLITKICLATGCRWGEAESLHARHVINGKITFTDTKNGKNRTVPISAELENEINNHGTGQLFTSSITSFRRALARTNIELPKGQAAHVLRHSFASHFMMNGGDILTLQRILGHSSITMTMRYAHLSPDHLAAATELNPLTMSTKCPQK